MNRARHYQNTEKCLLVSISLEATHSSLMTSMMFILGLKNVFLQQLEGMAQWPAHLV